MTTIPRSQNHLAELLGVSKGSASRMAAKGMPTDSLEAAAAWRKTHLDPARTKGNRFDEHRRPRTVPQPDHVRHASELMAVAHAALQSGCDIDSMVPLLRAALRAVPAAQRDDVELQLPVVRVLVHELLAILPPRGQNPVNDDGTAFYCDGATMSDEDAQLAGSIWYGLAAAEWRVKGRYERPDLQSRRCGVIR